MLIKQNVEVKLLNQKFGKIFWDQKILPRVDLLD